MAITSIAKSFSTKPFNLRLPFRRPSSPKLDTPPSETTIHVSSDGLNPINKEEEFRRVFQYLDGNNDGKISADELRAYFSSIGDSMAAEQAEKIILEFSTGEDSPLLEFREFVRMMELRDSEDDKVLRQAFEVYEVEKGSGCITPEGLRQVLGRLGDVKTYQECEAMIRVFDLDGNGVLDFHEFCKMMT